MSELEWYLEIAGKQSGPHSAKEIVEWVRSGKISETSQVTAARMSGDWVTAKDLVEAYDELFAKPAKVPTTTLTNSATQSDPNFQAPPRPTEQLEATKNIYLNRGTDLDAPPDPTEALFQAIQAVREKSARSSVYATTAGTSPSISASNRDSFGQVKRAGGPTFPPQVILIATLAAIFGITVYGISALISGKNAETEAKKAPVADAAKKTAGVADDPSAKDQNVTAPAGGSGLLNADGAGTGTPNPNTRTPITPKRSTNVPSRTSRSSPRLDPGGGARYRDDRDTPMRRTMDEEEDEDIDENESDTPNQPPVPVDPSQVPLDKVIPEPGSVPGSFPEAQSEPHALEENPGQ